MLHYRRCHVNRRNIAHYVETGSSRTHNILLHIKNLFIQLQFHGWCAGCDYDSSQCFHIGRKYNSSKIVIEGWQVPYGELLFAGIILKDRSCVLYPVDDTRSNSGAPTGRSSKLNSPFVFVSVPFNNTSFFFFLTVSVATDFKMIAETRLMGCLRESVILPYARPMEGAAHLLCLRRRYLSE
jgi:hypothetical protein